MGISIKKYLSPKSYANYALKQFNRHVLHHLDIFLAPKLNQQFKYPPIFIIGAPRSGSTLLFQILTDAFDVAYLSNLHCNLFGSPALAEKIFQPLNNKQPSDYSSKHGRTNGLSGPSECGEWWYRFFRRMPAHVPLVAVHKTKMRKFRRSVMAFTKAAGKPVLFKNLYASLRLEPLSKYLPEALYIIVTRNELFNAASILSGRKKAFGSYEKWWSVPPPGWEQLQDKTASKQVVGQIRAIYAEIDRVIAKGFIKESKVLRVEYEELCRDTQSLIETMDEFFSYNGLKIARRFEVPDSFIASENISLPADIADELKILCEKKEV